MIKIGSCKSYKKPFAKFELFNNKGVLHVEPCDLCEEERKKLGRVPIINRLSLAQQIRENSKIMRVLNGINRRRIALPTKGRGQHGQIKYKQDMKLFIKSKGDMVIKEVKEAVK